VFKPETRNPRPKTYSPSPNTSQLAARMKARRTLRSLGEGGWKGFGEFRKDTSELCSEELHSIPFCVHQGTMEPMRQVAPALWRQDSKNSRILGSSSSYSICVPPSLTLTSLGLSSPRATKL